MLVLTVEELRELTDRVRPTAQAQVLDAMKIPYRWRPKGKNPRGSLAVLRIHVETPAVDGTPASRYREPKLMP
jgi:hypothetical protein